MAVENVSTERIALKYHLYKSKVREVAFRTQKRCLIYQEETFTFQYLLPLIIIRNSEEIR